MIEAGVKTINELGDEVMYPDVDGIENMKFEAQYNEDNTVCWYRIIEG